jgi:hypothetical protein
VSPVADETKPELMDAKEGKSPWQAGWRICHRSAERRLPIFIKETGGRGYD